MAFAIAGIQGHRHLTGFAYESDRSPLASTDLFLKVTTGVPNASALFLKISAVIPPDKGVRLFVKAPIAMDGQLLEQVLILLTWPRRFETVSLDRSNFEAAKLLACDSNAIRIFYGIPPPPGSSQGLPVGPRLTILPPAP